MTGLNQHIQDEKAAPSEAPLVRIAIRIFDERERRHLQQILLLATLRLPGKFVTVPAAEAEVVFINPEEPGAEVFIRNARRGKRPVPVIYGGEAQRDLPWLAKPAISNDLIELINKLPDFLREVETERRVAGQDAEPLPLIETHDFSSVMQRLQSLKRSDHPTLIDTGRSHVLVDPRPGIAYVPAQAAGPQLGRTYEAMAAIKDSQISHVSRADLVEKISSFRHESISLEELGWSLAFMARPREPAPVQLMQTRFRLRHWPNFARLEHTQLHLLWAGMLIRQPMNLAALLARSPQGFAPVARFYNGCALAGLLINSDQTRGPSALVQGQTKRSGIFKRLLDKLAG